MHSKCIYLFDIPNQTLGMQVNPHLCFIASYVNSWTPGLNISFSNIYAAFET